MKIFLFLLVFLLCGINGDEAGFKTVISQNGLNYLNGIGMGLLQKQINGVTIPEIDGEVDTPAGKVDFQLQDIAISSFSISSSTATTVPGKGISLNLSGMTCHVTLSWHYKRKEWPHVSDHGTADIDVSSVSAAISIEIVASNGRPHVSVLSDSVNVGSLDIHLHGGASWLYDIFIKIFAGKIKDALSKALTSAFTDNVNNGLNAALSTLPVDQPVNKEVEIDYEITSNPTFTSSYLETPANGEFYEIASPSECPGTYCVRSQTPDSITSSMLQMIITDFVGNSAGYVFYKLGKLHASIENKDLPPDSPIQLNTSSFRYIIPNLYSHYPNLLMKLEIDATQPPNCGFATSGATVSTTGDIHVLVIEPNGTAIPAFTLNGTVIASGIAILKGLDITGNLTYLKGNFGLESSEIGKIDVSLFDSLLNLLFSNGIIPAVNTLLAQGFALPTVKGLTFKNPTIGWGNHYLYVSTDVTYDPSALQNIFQPINIH